MGQFAGRAVQIISRVTEPTATSLTLMEEELAKNKDVKDARNGEPCGIQNVKRISIMLAAVFAHQIAQLVCRTLDSHALKSTTLEAMDIHSSASKDGNRVELFAIQNVNMEPKAMDLSVGDNAQLELMNVVHFASLKENLAAICMYLDR